MRKLFGLLLCAPLVLGVTSCSSGDSAKPEQPKATTAKEVGAGKGLATTGEPKVVLPSPMEIASLIQRTGINYEEGILNPTSQSEFYTTNYRKSLNLGVYGADLGLILVFDQTQDAINYFKTVKTIAEELGVLSAFEQSTLNRVDKNIGNRDSLMTIAAKAFQNADMYLKENERNAVSALVIAGGWIEGLYLSTKFGSVNYDAAILSRVGEQKKSLETLITLVSRYKGDGDGYAKLYADLEDLMSSYEKVKITYEAGANTINKEKRVIEQGTKSKVEISKETFDEIAGKINVIREQIIN